jgi:hypothetical protein
MIHGRPIDNSGLTYPSCLKNHNDILKIKKNLISLGLSF